MAQNKSRLGIQFLVIAWLAVASLSSAIIRFATLLLDRATYHLAKSDDWALSLEFRHFMSKLMGGALLVAIFSALLSIFGLALLFQPRWLRKDSNAWAFYCCVQLVAGVCLIIVDGYLASQARGFRSTFDIFRGRNHIPYWEVIYYGTTSKAIFGSIVSIFYLAYIFVCY